MASAAAAALSIWTLATPSTGLYSQPCTTGAQRGAIAATSSAAAFGRRWPRKISPSASLRPNIRA